MNIQAINEFKLPETNSKNLKIEQYVGYFSRKSMVFVNENNNNNHIRSNIEINAEILLWFKKLFEENSPELQNLVIYKNKIENIDENVTSIGKKLISDYEKPKMVYTNTPHMCLIKLEQLFILNELSSIYVDNVIKQSESLSYGKNILDWIITLTQLEQEKIDLLKEYLDEYFGYLFDRPKSIYQINGFDLPLKNLNNLKTEQYVAFLNRKSGVVLVNNCIKSYKEANQTFFKWFEYNFGKESNQSKEIDEYCNRIENISESVEIIESQLTGNLDAKKCLIKLEQLFIRYEIPSIYVYEFINPNTLTNTYGENILDWIITITGLEIDKIKLLKEYLDEYFQHLFERPKNILKVNDLMLPIAKEDRTLTVEQYAGYFIRESVIFITYIDNVKIITHKAANNSILLWFKFIFGEYSENYQQINIFRKKIENIQVSDHILKLRNKIVKDSYSERCLIKLEQFFIRHNLSTRLVYDYTKPINPNKCNPYITELLVLLTNKKRKKIVDLKEYLDDYFYDIIGREKNCEQIIDIWESKDSLMNSL